ncbi:MAG: phenylacetate--CoA ligase family protein [Conexivisphaerales archaeon]
MTSRGSLYSLAQRASGVDYSAPFTKINGMAGDEDRLTAGTEALLKELLLHAYRNVPYYHALFEGHGLVEGGRVEVSRFDSLPLLTKETIREHASGFTSTGARGRGTYEDSTGGSTGEPLHVMKDAAYDGWRIACQLYFYREFLCLDYFRARKLSFSNPFRWPPNGPKRSLGEWLNNSARLDGLLLTEDAMGGYVKRLNSFRPDSVQGMADTLYELGRFIEARGLKVHRPKVVVSYDVMLYDHMREEIEAAFGCKVHDLYGAVEAGMIAGECGSGSMHVFSFDSKVELLPGGKGGEAEIVVTPLHNFAMPLIRYRIGDEAFPGVSKCGCGSVLPTIGRVAGRTTDYFVREDGGLVHGLYFISLLRDAKEIRAFQVVQEDYERIRILVRAAGLSEAWRRSVEEKVRLAMGPACRVVWEFVDEVPRTPLGKHLFVKSLVHRDR